MSWREEVGPSHSRSTATQGVFSTETLSRRDDNGETAPEGQGQSSEGNSAPAISAVSCRDLGVEQSLRLLRFPSMPMESPTEDANFVGTSNAAVQATSGTTQAQQTSNTLMVPQAASRHLLAVPGHSSPPERPNSTATDNVPSLILDQTSSDTDSASM